MTLLITPCMRYWMQRRIAARPVLVAAGTATAVAPGTDPDRVLLLGSGPASGIGVRTQEAALTGRLAAALAASTGRGAVVDALAAPDLGIADVHALVRRASLDRYDGVVLFTGLADAITCVSARVWRRRLRLLLDDVVEGVAADTTVVMTSIPPASAIGTYDGLPTRLADRRVDVLNRILLEAADRPRVRLVDLPVPSRLDGPADRYAQWAEALVEAVAPPAFAAPAQ